MTDRDSKQDSLSVYRRIARSWLILTVSEQRAVVIVLVLFLLGLAVRLWYVQKGRAEAALQFHEVTTLADSMTKQGEAAANE